MEIQNVDKAILPIFPKKSRNKEYSKRARKILTLVVKWIVKHCRKGYHLLCITGRPNWTKPNILLFFQIYIFALSRHCFFDLSRHSFLLFSRQCFSLFPDKGLSLFAKKIFSLFPEVPLSHKIISIWHTKEDEKKSSVKLKEGRYM